MGVPRKGCEQICIYLPRALVKQIRAKVKVGRRTLVATCQLLLETALNSYEEEDLRGQD